MGITVNLPDDLALELDRKVASGQFTSRDEAAAHFIRKGMRGGGGGIDRPGPPRPPGAPEPTDRPIRVDPTDVNWAQ